MRTRGGFTIIYGGHGGLYKRALRALGAFLDARQPYRFRVIEVAQGFEVIVEDQPPGPRLESFLYDRRDLLSTSDDLSAGIRTVPRTTRLWRLSRSDREAFLAMLGSELDEVGAHNIVLDELDDALLISYSVPDKSRQDEWHKHCATLYARDIEAILDSGPGDQPA